MKKIIYVLAIAFALVSANVEAQKNYVKLSGAITNPNSNSLVITNDNGVSKEFEVKEDGAFLFTFKIETGRYALVHGNDYTFVYLKNGYDLKITLDTKQFDETITYSGIGEEPNNYLAKKARLPQKLNMSPTLFELEKDVFDQKKEAIIKGYKELLSNTKNLDAPFILLEEKEIEGIAKNLDLNYERNKQAKLDKLAILALKGQASPKFKDYENYAGGTTSLDDLKGKYVYMDLWATWCGPCKDEIPFLKEVEEKYHGKNIEFVSISIDRLKDHEAWKAMVSEKQLTGIQLYAKEDQQFMGDYKVVSIPRFILIDPQGKIISADAPRPSDKNLIELFNTLKI